MHYKWLSKLKGSSAQYWIHQSSGSAVVTTYATVIQLSPHPSSFPRRHGHIFVPSWEHKGPDKHTVTALMSSTVRPRHSPAAFELAVLRRWKRYLPQPLLVRIHTYNSLVHAPPLSGQSPSLLLTSAEAEDIPEGSGCHGH